MSSTPILEALDAFANGDMIIVTDDESRENEGDLVLAASHCTPEKMAFIIRHTSGIVCAPLPLAEARRLNLAPMVGDNDAPLSTAFTVSVDVRHGLTTGISADERTNTVRALANANQGASDFARPGHVFPLIAREGGVLIRSGHTEACVDLCRLAGLPPVGVISELVNDDGTVKRGSQLQDFAKEHKLKIVSVADLIAYRQRKEKLVTRVDSAVIQTMHGPATACSYSVPWDPMQHLALVFGDIHPFDTVPVRLQAENILQDVFQADSGLDSILKLFAKRQKGVVVYLRDGSVGVAGSRLLRPREREETHSEAALREEEWREIGLGAQILKDLGVAKLDLYASRQRHYVGLAGFDLEIVSTQIV